jgi:SAM-dependent methyltransferase
VRRLLTAPLSTLALTLARASTVATYAAAGTLTLEALQRDAQRDWRDFGVGQSDQDIAAGLFPWERDFCLPFLKPSDRILVVGCGSGRDLLALLELGYHVAGLEPVAHCVALAGRRLAERGLRAELITAPIEIAALQPRYDVFLFSWFCYSYIPLRARRVRALEKVRALLPPDGRVLISYIRAPAGAAPQSLAPGARGRVGHALRLASRVRRRLRGAPRQPLHPLRASVHAGGDRGRSGGGRAHRRLSRRHGRRQPRPGTRVMAMTKLVVWEPFRSIFYAPQWVTIHGGHFAAEGLEVEVRTAGGGVTTTGVLLDGGAQIALGGIMRSLDVADRGGAFLPHFAEVNSRNGFFLLGRRPRFAWSELRGATVLGFAEAPTPWQCMLTVLRQNGVDPASVRIERTRPAPEAMAAFRSGYGDFLETGQPFTEDAAGRRRRAPRGVHGRGHGAGALLVVHDDDRVPARRPRDAGALHARAGPGAAVDGAGRTERDRRRDRARLPGRRSRAAPPRGGALPRAGYVAFASGAQPRRLRVPAADLLDGGFIKHRHRYEDLVDESVARHVVDSLGRTG